MHIQNSIQSGFFRISDNLSNTVKPSVIYLIFWRIPILSKPCDRDSDCLEAGRLDLFEGRLGSLRIAPHGLTGKPVVMSIEMITHIPSHTETVSHLPCKVAVVIRSDISLIVVVRASSSRGF